MFILSGLSEAVNFLTIFKLKVKSQALYTDRLKKSIKYFPFAGLLIGIILASVFYVFNKFLPVQSEILLVA